MSGSGDHYRQAYRRGTLFNLVGGAAGLLQPLLIAVLTWLFSAEVMAGLLLAIFLTEIAATAISSGFSDATIVFASRVADEDGTNSAEEESYYRILAHGFFWTLVMSLTIALLVQVGAPQIVQRWFSEYKGLISGLKLAAWALVPLAFTQMCIATTKTKMQMQYDALVCGVLQPLLLLAGGIVVWRFGGGLAEILVCYLVTQCIVALVMVPFVARHAQLRRIARAFGGTLSDGTLIRFAGLQSIQLTLTRYVVRLDTLMLAAMRLPPLRVAQYGTASLLTDSLRQIRQVFGHALTPIAARYYAAGNRKALQDTISATARWITTLIGAAVLVILVLRNDLMRLFDPRYADDTLFIALLLISPFVNCALGLAANGLTFAGHGRWNLVNSIFVGGLNTALNYLLIPRYGMWGAAMATAVAGVMLRLFQTLQLAVLEQLWIRPKDVYKPYVALAAALGLLFFVWDPAQIPNMVARMLITLGALVLFIATLALLRLEELQRFWPFSRMPHARAAHANEDASRHAHADV